MTTLTGRGLGTFSGTARGYTPAEPSKWNPVPDRVAEALDIVAGGGGAIALANAFVWQPGGPTSAPGLYNSTSFGPVAAAMSVVPGPKRLGIDTTYGVATIAGGPYELSDVTFEPCLLTSFALVTFAVGAEISADTTNLTLRRTEFEVLGTSGAVWTPSEAGAQMTLDSSLIICTAGGVFLDVADSTVFTLTLENSGTIATSMGGVAVAKVEASGVLDVLAVTNAIIDTNVFAQGVASGGEVNVQADGSAFIDTTQGAGPVYTYLVRDPTPTAIFAPGATGTLNGNVFTDPELLRQWLNLAPGAPRTVLVDDSGGTASTVAGTWNIDGVTFRSKRTGAGTTLHIVEGTLLVGSRFIVDDSITISCDATATVPMVSSAATNPFIRPQLRGSCTLKSTTAIPFFQKSAGGSITVLLLDGVVFGDGVHPVLTVDAGQSAIVAAYAGSTINTGAIAGAGSATSQQDSSSRTGVQTVATLTVFIPDLAGNLAYTTSTKTGNYTLLAPPSLTPDYRIILNSAGGAFAITLPAPAAGLKFELVDMGNNLTVANVTLTRHGAESINGVAGNLALVTSGARYVVTCDGTNWWVNKSLAGG